MYGFWLHRLYLQTVLTSFLTLSGNTFNLLIQRNCFTRRVREWRLQALWFNFKAKKNVCVFTVTCQKNIGSVGRHTFFFFFFFFFLTIGKTEIVVPGSGIRFRYFIFEISVKPSFVLWRVTQFFYLLCSQFRQKASGWINKTLLLIKQHKWLSEFCVQIDRVVSKKVRVGGWKIGWVGWS